MKELILMLMGECISKLGEFVWSNTPQSEEIKLDLESWSDIFFILVAVGLAFQFGRVVARILDNLIEYDLSSFRIIMCAFFAHAVPVVCIYFLFVNKLVSVSVLLVFWGVYSGSLLLYKYSDDLSLKTRIVHFLSTCLSLVATACVV